MYHAPQAMVALFLIQAKQAIAAGHIELASRPENTATLLRLGLTPQDQLDSLLALTPQDYYRCEPPPQGVENDAWAFGVDIQNVEIYIKLKIIIMPIGNHVICISFHQAEFPLTYPYR